MSKPSASRVRWRNDPDGEPKAAHQTMKRVKAGILTPDEMGSEEWGHLYLYYPDMLPDVEVLVGE